MKKLLFCGVCITLAHTITAENRLTLSWNFGNMGGGIQYASDETDHAEITASLFTLTIEHRYSFIGFEYSPVKYWRRYAPLDPSENGFIGEMFSFLNAAFYWNILGRKKLVVGPFVSVNYMCVDTAAGFDPRDIVFTGGLLFSYRLKDAQFFQRYNTHLFRSEFGYRNVMGKNKVYVSIYIDIIPALEKIGRKIADNEKNAASSEGMWQASVRD
jgi:hypothetical protein